MTAEEEAAWGRELDLRSMSHHNRSQIDRAILTPYIGELIAWSPDGTRIVAHAKDDDALYRLLAEAGELPSLCLVEYVGGSDTEL